MIYRKLIDDETCSYSDGRLIICSDGRVIANPSAETLAEEGWEEYTPPVVEPGPQLTPGIDELLAALQHLATDTVIAMPDNEAAEVAALFPTWESMMGKDVAVGERYWYNGSLYKVQTAHAVQQSWNPVDAPALFINVSDELTPEAGTLDNPIAWASGMVSYNGKYYSEGGVTYLCFRDSVNPLYYPISQLIDHYFHTVE